MRREGEETQSLLSSSSSTNTTKKRNTNYYYYYYVALGVVASAGILGTVSSKSSSSAAFPRGGDSHAGERQTDDSLVGRVHAGRRAVAAAVRTEIVERCGIVLLFSFDRSKETRHHHRASKRDSSFCGTRSKSIRILMRARAPFENNNNNNNTRRRREGSAAPFSLCCASLLLLLLPLLFFARILGFA